MALAGLVGPVIVGLVAIVGLCGCRSSSGSNGPTDAQAAAELASRDGNWEVAAELWHDIHLVEGPSSVRPCVETARALEQLGDWESAAAIVALGLKHNPDDPALLEEQAAILCGRGFRRAAEPLLVQALAVEPDRVSALKRLAQLRIALGNATSAIEPLQHLIDLNEADYETFEMLARAHREAGRSVAAFDAWSRAFTLGEGEVEDFVCAASLCLDADVRKAYPDAAQRCERWLARAIERDPQCTYAHFQVAVLHERSGNDEAALLCYRRAVETDPSCLVALTNLALLYARTGDPQATRETVERVLALERNLDRRRALQRLLESLGAFTEDGTGEDASGVSPP